MCRRACEVVALRVGVALVDGDAFLDRREINESRMMWDRKCK